MRVNICRLLVVILCLLVLLTVWKYHRSRSFLDFVSSSERTEKSCHTLLHLIRKDVHRAHRSARSGETRLSLEHILKLLGVQGEEDVGHVTSIGNEKPEVCEEYWTGGRPVPGGDIADNVFKTKPCDRIPLENLVEILLYAESCDAGLYLVERIKNVYPKVNINLAVGNFGHPLHSCKKVPSVIIQRVPKEDGSAWLQLNRFVRTKYVLVGRNMVDFTYHTDIDRMIRVMNDLKVDAVGGAVRLEPEGRWYAGCYQSTIRNFTLRIQPGHDISSKSCAYCDYIASPFLIRRDLLQRLLEYRSELSGALTFVEMFLKQKQSPEYYTLQTMSCIDVLFHVAGESSGIRGQGVAEIPKHFWFNLAKHWTLDRVILPGQVDYKWTCQDLDISCRKYQNAGVILPRCCLEELSGCVKGFLNLASEYNISVFVFAGTLVGAVKTYGGFLPWERDADIVWDPFAYDHIRGPISKRLKDKFQCDLGPVRLETAYGDNVSACAQALNTSCLYYKLHSRSWNIDLWGDPHLEPYRLNGLINPTQVYLDGLWVSTVPNPGRVARHRYGDNVLGHVQHWQDYGLKTSWESYANFEKKAFLPCPARFVRHACLSGNYLPHGNIQFQDFPP